MSIKACLPGLIAEGKISKEQADEAAGLFDELARDYRRQFGDQTADAMATQATIEALKRKSALEKRQKLLQIQSQKGALVNMARYNGGKGDNIGAAALAMLDHDPKAPYGNVDIRRRTIIGQAHALMEGVINRFSRDLLGRMRNGAEMADVVRELFGTDTGNPAAKQFAEAWTAAAEMLRQRFNAAGGAIGRLDRWGLPQSHDPVKVRTAGYEAWRGFITPLLDRPRMIDRRTGKPFGDEALELALKDVFETISTDGWINRNAGGQGQGKKLANQRADHRFLIFADGDAWLSYADRFGAGATAFDAMIGHIDGMARDIAHMEILGPNPGATIEWLQDLIRKQAAMKGERPTLLRSAEGQATALGKLYDVTRGEVGIPVNPVWARNMQGVRSVITAAKLGGAVISATTDIGFQAVTRAYNGLPATGAITGYVKLLNPLAAEDRAVAVRLGLIAEEAGRIAGGINRYMGESIGPGIAARMADFTLRASGLSAWTQAGKWAFGMEMLGHLHDISNRTFDRLRPAERSAFERYGITAADWDHIRLAQHLNHEGAIFVDPAKLDRRIGDKLLQMVLTETNYAVPEVTARARAITSFGRPGTLTGEIGRNAMQFKGFSVSMLLTHGRRTMAEQGWNRAKYAAGLVITTTLLGALAMQLKQVAAGKDPQPMKDDPKFWVRAMMQGGGAGIFGDFLGTAFQQQLSSGAGVTRANSLAEAVAGPVVGAISDLAALAGAPFDKHPERRVPRQAAKIIKGYTPASSLWYARAGFQRLIVDQLQAQTDPAYAQSFNMMERAADAQGQDYWWRPGETAPERMPDWTNVGEAAPQQ